MTENRKAYLGKCSTKERILRDVILRVRGYISHHKSETKRNGIPVRYLAECFDSIKRFKVILTALRHELERVSKGGREK